MRNYKLKITPEMTQMTELADMNIRALAMTTESKEPKGKSKNAKYKYKKKKCFLNT